MLKAVGLGAWFAPWLGKPETALVTVALISVWQFVGIPMILFYAALIGIPDELTEAARVDGATAWDTFWRIKFPLILPTVGIVGVLTFVGNFNAFDLIYTMKGANAGPDFATDIMGIHDYDDQADRIAGSEAQSPTMMNSVGGSFLSVATSAIRESVLCTRSSHPHTS